MTLQHENLTERIIGAAIEVHKQQGPGFIESIYENSLVIELRKRRIRVQQQLEIPVFYDGIEVGKPEPDRMHQSMASAAGRIGGMLCELFPNRRTWIEFRGSRVGAGRGGRQQMTQQPETNELAAQNRRSGPRIGRGRHDR